MKKSKDIFADTITLYNQLGKKYISDTFQAKPFGLSDFIRILPKNAHILDVGCAGGRDTLHFIKKGFTVIGIDLSEVFLLEAQKNIPEATFMKMDVRNLSLPKESFDGIWAQAVLLHIERKFLPKVVVNFHKILKPGGVLCISVKRGKGIHVIKEKISGQGERTFTFYLKSEIDEIIKNAGFKILTSEIKKDNLKRKGLEWVCILAQKKN